MFSVVSSYAVNVFPTASKKDIPEYKNQITNLDLDQFLKLRPADLRHLTKGRVTLKDRVVLKLVQKSVAKAIEERD